jgi:hypothetical protein
MFATLNFEVMFSKEDPTRLTIVREQGGEEVKK